MGRQFVGRQDIKVVALPENGIARLHSGLLTSDMILRLDTEYRILASSILGIVLPLCPAPWMAMPEPWLVARHSSRRKVV